LALAAEAPAASASVRWEFPPAHVLVVDDGAENRQLVRVLLEEVGLTVSEAGNGRIAIDRIAAEKFDLVLMDMQMPEMDGQTATRHLRAAGCTLPIVALTANAMKGFESELDEAGFSGFLTKPIDVDALFRDLATRLNGRAVDMPLGYLQVEAAPAELEVTAHKADPFSPAVSTAELAAPAIVSRLSSHAKLGRIVARFVDQLPGKLDQMSSAVERNDLAELSALAHWLKGAGGSMGFDELFEPAKSLEDAARSGDVAMARSIMLQLRGIERQILAGMPASAELTEAGA
jgi:CheY-like chemotaxis protein